jgi:transcriptional regulator NrdR
LGDKVVDSRESKEGEVIRRRRECLGCGKRFTSYERIDEIPYMVVKKDGTREKFDRQKLMNGLLKACEKRPVSLNQLETVVNEVEYFVQEASDRERGIAAAVVDIDHLGRKGARLEATGDLDDAGVQSGDVPGLVEQRHHDRQADVCPPARPRGSSTGSGHRIRCHRSPFERVVHASL